jgi:enamine deaminase RidA (YjgF/YER057c/UK114 family)
MAEIQRFRISERMSQCIVHGTTVYTAGQVAQSAPGASVANQTRAILVQIDELLAEAGDRQIQTHFRQHLAQ